MPTFNSMALRCMSIRVSSEDCSNAYSVARTGAKFHVRSGDLYSWTRRYKPNILAIQALRT